MAFLALLVASFFLGKCSTLQDRNNALNSIIALRDTVSTYKVKVNGLMLDVFEKNALILSQKEAIKTGIIEKEALRKLNINQVATITYLSGLISILRDSVSHSGEIVYIDTSSSTPAILLPFTFGESDEYHSFSGGFNIKGQMNYAFNVPVSLDVWVGVNKNKATKAVITTQNPYIKIKEITSVKIDVQKPSRWGVSAFLGAGITIRTPIVIAPMLGVGIDYRIFSF